MSAWLNSSTNSSQVGDNGGHGAARKRGGGGGDHQARAMSRRRCADEVWPEHFVEALATLVAVEASRSVGRLAAASAVANVFGVCSTWRSVSRSDILWRQLTKHVWGRTTLLRDTWQLEYLYWHRTAQNFRSGKSAHAVLHFDPCEVESPDGLRCRSLAVSDRHLACGFADGAVRLFDLATRAHVRTFRSLPGDIRGRYSQAVTGVVMVNDDPRLVFATLGGDVHVASVDSNNGDAQLPRRVHVGDVENDGPMLEFSGNGRWWVGLYAGVPGQSIRIWDEQTEELVFVGGSLTDPEALRGWYTLVDWNPKDPVGRIRVTDQDKAVACAGSRVMVLDLSNNGAVLYDEEGLVVGSFDVSSDAYTVVDKRGWARVRRLDTLEEVRRFRVAGGADKVVMSCMNRGFALMCAGGAVRVWEVDSDELLYSFREVIGDVTAVASDERHVAIGCGDGRVHLWDFGADTNRG